MAGYYDYIFGLVPLALLGITGALTVAGLQLTTAVPVTAGMTALLTGHTLFMNGSSSPSPFHLNEHTGPNAADTLSPSILNAG